MIFSHKQSLIIAINKIIVPPKKKSKPGPEVLTEKEERALTLSTLLTSITTKIEVLRDAEGNIPYGTVKRLVAHHQIFLPWLTRDHVNNHLRKLNKLGRSTNQATSPSTLSDPDFPSSLSTLTSPCEDTLSLPAPVQL